MQCLAYMSLLSAHLDVLEALDPKKVILTGRRTRGIRVDYTRVTVTVGLDDDSGSETEAKGPKESLRRKLLQLETPRRIFRKEASDER
jgi:hypothetical protein